MIFNGISKNIISLCGVFLFFITADVNAFPFVLNNGFPRPVLSSMNTSKFAGTGSIYKTHFCEIFPFCNNAQVCSSVIETITVNVVNFISSYQWKTDNDMMKKRHVSSSVIGWVNSIVSPSVEIVSISLSKPFQMSDEFINIVVHHRIFALSKFNVSHVGILPFLQKRLLDAGPQVKQIGRTGE